MDNNIILFENKQFGTVRTIDQNGEPWFVATDICIALGLSNTTVAVNRLDTDEVTKFNLGGLSGETNIINESGLYNLVIRSHKPEAKQFKRWITHDVIPSIRKHGLYATPQTIENILNDPDAFLKTLQAYSNEKAARIQAEEKLKHQEPLVTFAQAVSGSETSILIGELSKILAQKGIDIGQNRLFAWMRDKNYLMQSGTSYNTPTQRSIEAGVLEIKERTVIFPDGRTITVGTPYVTGKGQIYFINKFLKKQ